MKTQTIRPITGSAFQADFGEIKGFNTCIKSHDSVFQKAGDIVGNLSNLLYYGGTQDEAAKLVERYEKVLESAKHLVIGGDFPILDAQPCEECNGLFYHREWCKHDDF